jgi:hypothetical protein
MHHFGRGEADLLGIWVQAATERGIPWCEDASSDISSIDPNGRRAGELEFARHSKVADQHFMYVGHNALRE